MTAAMSLLFNVKLRKSITQLHNSNNCRCRHFWLSLNLFASTENKALCNTMLSIKYCNFMQEIELIIIVRDQFNGFATANHFNVCFITYRNCIFSIYWTTSNYFDNHILLPAKNQNSKLLISSICWEIRNRLSNEIMRAPEEKLTTAEKRNEKKTNKKDKRNGIFVLCVCQDKRCIR